MVRAFLLSVGQLGDRAVLRVLAKSLATTLVLFVLLGIGVWWGTRAGIAAWVGYNSTALSALFALSVTVLALWLLFRAVAIGVVAIFADEIVTAVEARHYPTALTSARPVRHLRAAAMGLRSATRVTLINLLMLPVYVALLVTGIGTAAAFFVVNGWLLGHDLGDMVSARHLNGGALRDWRRATRGERFLLGLVDTGLFVVPFVNILAPVLGAAMATHLFHARRGGQA